MTWTANRSLISAVSWPLIGSAFAAVLTVIVRRNARTVTTWRRMSERISGGSFVSGQRGASAVPSARAAARIGRPSVPAEPAGREHREPDGPASEQEQGSGGVSGAVQTHAQALGERRRRQDARDGFDGGRQAGEAGDPDP